ncbi:hypothetical protein [Dictyobacter arantiisoli]|uniref:Uncharacterized protein n=1 Tax=Dictyobacter arantiisoli TaxID=2014874 RepID=A0A5A5TKJ7_9CHLR|nr:hypothetical protein [Dictyobacter arantiisoli]GCF11579.1 hypothetical protein KDI_51430 [Dictyobacter arantiisoli]
MNNLSLDFLQNDTVLDDSEVDELFTDMLHVEPPTDMVGRIMQAVSLLPQPRPLSHWKDFELIQVEDDLDQLA